MQHTSTTDYDEDVEAFRAFIEELSGYHRAWRASQTTLAMSPDQFRTTSCTTV